MASDAIDAGSIPAGCILLLGKTGRAECISSRVRQVLQNGKMSKKKKKNHKNPTAAVRTETKDIIKDDAAAEKESGKGEPEKTPLLTEKKEEKTEAPSLSDTMPIPGNITEILAAELPTEEDQGPDTGSILEEAVNEARERLAQLNENTEERPAAGEDAPVLFAQEETAPLQEPPIPVDAVFEGNTAGHSYTREEAPVQHYIPESVTQLHYTPEDGAEVYPKEGEPALPEDRPAGEQSRRSRALSAKKAELLSELSSEIAGTEEASDLELIELPEIEDAPEHEESVKPAPGPGIKTGKKGGKNKQEKLKPEKTKAEKRKTEKKKAAAVKSGHDEIGDTERREKAQRRRGNSWFERNRQFCLAAVALILVGTAVLIFVIGLTQKNKAEKPEESVSVDVVLSSSEDGESAVLIPTDPLTENTDEDLKNLVAAYFKARQENDIDAYSALRSYTDSLEKAKLEAKSEYIEAYRNIKLYTKPGPYDDSLMVYVSYDLKLKEFEQTVPALETLVVCREKAEGSESSNESESGNEAKGRLYVYSGGFDENVVEYIKAITAQEDVVDLFKHVDTAYQEIMDSDPEYEEYMASLKQLIRDGVGERLAAEAEEDASPTPGAEDGKDGEDGEGDTDAEGGEEADGEEEKAEEEKSFMVEATTAVNVRASDSENADRVGNVNPGTQLTCLGQLANGWSKVIFEQKEAYIKSEYLRVIQTEADVKVQGKVTVKDTVNIRADANTTSAVLGSAFAGTTYDYVEKRDDGWTSILYNGKVAFIKSEYLK